MPNLPVPMVLTGAHPAAPAFCQRHLTNGPGRQPGTADRPEGNAA